jgi:putative ABC transport system ATP-binding protein
VIVIEDLNKVYSTGVSEVKALNAVNLTINSGEFLSIMGPSGSGKSTLMNILGCLDIPTSGRYCLDGEDVSKLSVVQRSELRNKKLGFVFQGFNLLHKMTALENVELPLVYAHLKGTQRRQLATRALELVGLTDRVHHIPTQLSGGQQQRVAIARAIVSNPKVILADEPTGNLDTQTGSEILEMFRKLNHDRGITLILVTHDPDIAAHTNRRILVRDGCVQTDETVDLKNNC